jgi:hypothetical protein
LRRFRESTISPEHEPLLPDLDRKLAKRLGISHTRPDSTKVAKLWERLADDPEFYIFGGFVRTFDEHDTLNPRKPFPTTPYLKLMLRFMHEGEEGDVVAFVKSRQMKFTWLVAAYCSWTAKFHDQARVIWQSKKDQDACSVVYRNNWYHSRIGFIERAQPKWLWSMGLKGTKGDLWYPNGAVISAIPQGPDMLRSYSASLVVSDECAFQPEFEPAYAAALPMAKGNPAVAGSGGRIILLSTVRAGSFFVDLTELDKDAA